MRCSECTHIYHSETTLKYSESSSQKMPFYYSFCKPTPTLLEVPLWLKSPLKNINKPHSDSLFWVNRPFSGHRRKKHTWNTTQLSRAVCMCRDLCSCSHKERKWGPSLQQSVLIWRHRPLRSSPKFSCVFQNFLSALSRLRSSIPTPDLSAALYLY